MGANASPLPAHEPTTNFSDILDLEGSSGGDLVPASSGAAVPSAPVAEQVIEAPAAPAPVQQPVPAAPATPVVGTTAPTQPPVAQPPAQQPQVGTQPATPAAPAPVPAPVAAPASPAAPAADDQTRFAQARDAAIQEIASKFTFTQDEVMLLQTNPEQVLPRLAAMVQVQAFESVYSAVMSAIPQRVQAELANARSGMEIEREFNDIFPPLKGQRELVAKAATLYYQAHPQARQQIAAAGPDRTRILREIGVMAHALGGVPYAVPAATPAAGPTLVPPVASQPPKPFVPAMGGASAGQLPAGSGSSDPWDSFVRESEALL